jgi:hypothetical protein
MVEWHRQHDGLPLHWASFNSRHTSQSLGGDEEVKPEDAVDERRVLGETGETDLMTQPLLRELLLLLLTTLEAPQVRCLCCCSLFCLVVSMRTHSPYTKHVWGVCCQRIWFDHVGIQVAPRVRSCAIIWHQTASLGAAGRPGARNYPAGWHFDPHGLVLARLVAPLPDPD